MLGAAIEQIYGGHLTIGPPLSSGFYYDCYLGGQSVPDEDLKKIDEATSKICGQKYPFQVRDVGG